MLSVKLRVQSPSHPNLILLNGLKLHELWTMQVQLKYM